MKACALVAGVLVLHLCLPGSLPAQPRGRGPGPSPCLPLENLGVTPEQERALADIHRSYQDRLQGLRRRLLARRLEFRAALANPQAPEEAIRSKAEEVQRLWLQCQRTTTDYYLAIRAVLTPEQRQKCFSAPPPGSPRNLDREHDDQRG